MYEVMFQGLRCCYLEEVAMKSPSSSRSLQNKTPLTKGTAVSSSRVRCVWNLNFFFFTKNAIVSGLRSHKTRTNYRETGRGHAAAAAETSRLLRVFQAEFSCDDSAQKPAEINQMCSLITRRTGEEKLREAPAVAGGLPGDIPGPLGPSAAAHRRQLTEKDVFSPCFLRYRPDEPSPASSRTARQDTSGGRLSE